MDQTNNPNINAYFISGLGADQRVFEKIKLPDEFRIQHLTWLTPFKNESLNAYCVRLAEKIDRSKPFVLIGLSFGGIVASELMQIVRPKMVIILSSISSIRQLPWYFKLGARLQLLRFLKGNAPGWTLPIILWSFSTKTEEEKKLLAQIIKETDPVFLKWALETLFKWTRELKADGIVHVHGSADRIFPLNTHQADKMIVGGGHFMVLSMADEVNMLLAEVLNGKT